MREKLLRQRDSHFMEIITQAVGWKEIIISILLTLNLLFLGSKEFDLGVMSGHLILATGQISYLKKICDNYPDKIDIMKRTYCAIEIIRRLIGYAQLPIKRSISEKSNLLKLSKELIIN